MGGVTAMALEELGVDFCHVGGGLLGVRGPKGDVGLLAQLRDAVLERMKVVQELPPSAGLGKCDCCGDPLPHYRGGMCSLCILARQKVVLG